MSKRYNKISDNMEKKRFKNIPIKTDLSNILKSNLVDTTDKITKKSEIKYVAANNWK